MREISWKGPRKLYCKCNILSLKSSDEGIKLICNWVLLTCEFGLMGKTLNSFPFMLNCFTAGSSYGTLMVENPFLRLTNLDTIDDFTTLTISIDNTKKQ